MLTADLTVILLARPAPGPRGPHCSGPESAPLGRYRPGGDGPCRNGRRPVPAPTISRCCGRLRLWLAPLVLALVVLTSCGESAHTSAPPQGIAQARTGPSAHLLSTGQMPTAGADWSSVDTVANDVEVLGPCHLTSLVDIGALSAVRRTWSTDGGAVPRAVQVVARFADNKSAWRAHQVLDSWQADCGERTDDAVGPLRERGGLHRAWARPTGSPAR